MNNVKKLFLILSYFFLFSCSFGLGSWSDISEELERIKERKNAKIIFSTQKRFQEEIDNEQKISSKNPILNQNWTEQNFTKNNFVPHLVYENKKVLTGKSKKLGKNIFGIQNIDFEPILENDQIIFYDPSGTIFSYSLKNLNINWKFNFYKKRYKTKAKDLNLAISLNSLIVSDNFGYVYSLNKQTGKINWAKNYGVPFRSNIKIDEDNIFLANQDNKFYVISENSGKQKLDLETFPSFLKTNSKINISVDNIKKNIYFVTTAAEIYSLNYKNRNINWLFNLTGSSSDQQVDLFYSSPIVYNNNEIILSSALSTFSMDSSSWTLNWEIPFSTNILPLVLNNYVFLTSKEGFVLNLNRKTGKVIWSRNIFNKLKKLYYEKTGDISSILFLSDSLFLTTENGYFISLDHQSGKIINFAKVAKNFFSKPIVSNGKILVIDDKMRILKFN